MFPPLHRSAIAMINLSCLLAPLLVNGECSLDKIPRGATRPHRLPASLTYHLPCGEFFDERGDAARHMDMGVLAGILWSILVIVLSNARPMSEVSSCSPR